MSAKRNSYTVFILLLFVLFMLLSYKIIEWNVIDYAMKKHHFKGKVLEENTKLHSLDIVSSYLNGTCYLKFTFTVKLKTEKDEYSVSEYCWAISVKDGILYYEATDEFFPD